MEYVLHSQIKEVLVEHLEWLADLLPPGTPLDGLDMSIDHLHDGCLQIAAMDGHENVARMILQQKNIDVKAIVNAVHGLYGTALVMAICTLPEREAMVELLLSYQADVNLWMRKNQIPVRRVKERISRLGYDHTLIDQIERAWLMDSNNMIKPLHVAAWLRKTNIVTILLHHGATGFSNLSKVEDIITEYRTSRDIAKLILNHNKRHFGPKAKFYTPSYED